MTNKKIFIGTPIGSRPSVPYFDALIRTLTNPLDGYEFTYHRVAGCCNIAIARNAIASVFLEETDCDELLWIDSDIAWTNEDLGRLLSHPVEFVGAPYMARNQNADPTSIDNWALFTDSSFALYYYNNGLIPMRDNPGVRPGGIGFGFVKTSRSVFETVIKHHELQQIKMFNNGEVKRMYPFFEFESFIGEDIHFCRLYNSTGGTVWCDPEIQVAHVTEGVIMEDFRNVVRKCWTKRR
jgi:hypothetical protein